MAQFVLFLEVFPNRDTMYLFLSAHSSAISSQHKIPSMLLYATLLEKVQNKRSHGNDVLFKLVLRQFSGRKGNGAVIFKPPAI